MSRFLRDFFTVAAVFGIGYALLIVFTMWGAVISLNPWPIGMFEVFVWSMIVGTAGIVGASIVHIYLMDEPVMLAS